MTSSDTTVERAFPDQEDPLYAPYFQGLAEGKIMVRRCLSCADMQWPPQEFCSTDQSTRFEWIPAATTGTIHSYSIVNRAFHPWFAARVPYAIIVADVAPGVRVTGNRFTGDLDSIECDQPVTATFRTDGQIPTVVWAEKPGGAY